MAEAGTLHNAFIDELRDAYDAERQLTKALSKSAKAATSPELREAFESHLAETQGQIERLEAVFASLDEKVRGKHCDGIAGIIEEGKSIMEENLDDATMDACLISAGQRAEHYEMAAYGTLVAWARAMGRTEAVDLLQQTLDEEIAGTKSYRSSRKAGLTRRLQMGPMVRTSRMQSPTMKRMTSKHQRRSVRPERRRRCRLVVASPDVLLTTPRPPRQCSWGREGGLLGESVCSIHS